MTKLAQNGLGRTDSCAVLSETWEVLRLKSTATTGALAVKKEIVSILFRVAGAISRIMRTMPMILPFRRPLLEHVLALGAEDVVSKAKVLM